MVEESLKANTIIVVPAGKDIVNVTGEMAGIIPLKKGYFLNYIDTLY